MQLTACPASQYSITRKVGNVTINLKVKRETLDYVKLLYVSGIIALFLLAIG